MSGRNVPSETSLWRSAATADEIETVRQLDELIVEFDTTGDRELATRARKARTKLTNRCFSRARHRGLASNSG